jgi:hypothetical protein
VIFVYDVLLPSEYDLAFKNPNIGAGIPHSDMVYFANFKKVPSLDQFRPFLGPELWALFWVHRAFCGRLCVKAVQGRPNGRIPEWDQTNDGKRDYTMELLERVLTAQEIEAIKNRKSHAPSLAVDLLEQHILAAADRWLSGASVANLSLAEGKRMVEALRFAREVEGR